MHFSDAICANAICAIAKLKTIKNLFNNNLILLYIIIYNNINIIIYLNEYIFDFQIAQLHNCTIAQLHELSLKHTGSGVLCAQRTEYGQICPKRKIFRQKRWFSQIFVVPLPCHWRFLLVLICSTKVSEKSDMEKSWAARLCRFARRRTFCCSGTYKESKTKMLRN